MIRSILSIPAAYVAWVIAFWVPIFATSMVWAALAQTGEQFRAEQRYDIFSTSQLILFQFVWLFANGAAGFTAAWVSRKKAVVWLVAVLLLAYFAYNHWYAIWDEMPAWYNTTVVLPVLPMVIVGGWLARRLRNSRA